MEGTLFDTLVKAGAISEDNADDLVKASWSVPVDSPSDNYTCCRLLYRRQLAQILAYMPLQTLSQ
jgi:hypothetical protein